MDKDFLEKRVLPHLSNQFERGLPILFTGAGFSLGAKNFKGESLPMGSELKKRLWEVAFPGDPVDSSSTLQSVFDHCIVRHRRATVELLKQCLSVDPGSVPEWYATYFRMPWARYYTLNIDDLLLGVAAQYALPVGLEILSATTDESAVVGRVSGPRLETIHLNGRLSDLPDNVTFSTVQYAQRLARPEPWFARLASDLVSQPCVFIGTPLDESPLWQNLEFRKMRGGRDVRELRPRSYLVTPRLDRAREALLEEFNIAWLPIDAQEFADRVLVPLGAVASLGFAVRSPDESDVPQDIPEVSKLASNPSEKSEFLLGTEPIWADLQSGRAIVRHTDEALWTHAQKLIQSSRSGLILLSGTAGSGKSTTAMRLALRFVAEGKKVGHLNRESDLTIRDIRREMRRSTAPEVLIIDDADVFGTELPGLVRNLLDGSKTLLVCSIRSGKVDRALPDPFLAEVPSQRVCNAAS